MYGFSIRLNDSFEKVVRKVTEALKTEGFGTITEIDVKNTLKEKLGIERDSYLILGACNPQLAHRVLEVDPDMGLLLPCNVVIRESDGNVTVAFLDPTVFSKLTDKPEITEIAKEALKRLESVRNKLIK